MSKMSFIIDRKIGRPLYNLFNNEGDAKKLRKKIMLGVGVVSAALCIAGCIAAGVFGGGVSTIGLTILSIVMGTPICAGVAVALSSFVLSEIEYSIKSVSKKRGYEQLNADKISAPAHRSSFSSIAERLGSELKGIFSRCVHQVSLLRHRAPVEMMQPFVTAYSGNNNANNANNDANNANNANSQQMGAW